MTQASQWLEEEQFETPASHDSKRLSFLKFLVRYPIFLLAFGPPIFRSFETNAGMDTSQAHFDLWNVIQVVLLFAVALRAILRLGFEESIRIPKQIRSILRLSLYLGLLFLISVVYSPGRAVSAEFSVLNFLTLICVVEFVVDCYRSSPDWLQCLYHLRLISFLLYLLVVLIVPFRPDLVLAVIPGAGIRLLGNMVAPVTVICPVMAIISAYSFLYRLESRVRSVFFFLVGMAGSILTQMRGMEIALMLCLAILGVAWAKRSRRSAQLFMAGLLGSILLFSGIAGVIGVERIWNTFNRGQNASGIASASGRTEMWKFAFRYCLTHPQGMGYIAGFRSLFTDSFNPVLGAGVKRLGTTHNAFIDILADAGWLALAIYVIIMFKTFALGWRFAKKRATERLAALSESGHAVRCGLLLFLFCMLDGMENSAFCVPLQSYYNYQNIIMAILLGACGTMIAASRSPQARLVE